MKVILLLSILSVTAVKIDDDLQLETVKCGGKGSEFSKTEVLTRLNKCVKNFSNETCVRVTKPEILLQKLYKLINTPSGISAEAFENCSKVVHEKMPFKLLNFMHQYNQLAMGKNKKRCMTQKRLCRDLTNYIRPFSCYVRKVCNRQMVDLGYALSYAFQQITLEQEGPLRCYISCSESQFDLNPSLYKFGEPLDTNNIVSEHMCNGVPEIETTDEPDPDNVLYASMYAKIGQDYH
ncbi:unnamed protein product [Bursaphelenchus okinawaensis]|uniref:Uncharacterized protein n=1 Tax=Bursaphelenchus okinawaensis TaxID=465554 RepID=A0A811KAN8_9BILA|nr:unnamed protein product [Bursaphelenchus okinawaensis]CAG9097717.1 unnamed protein product [Bursaphelenchus okinawaensis]